MKKLLNIESISILHEMIGYEKPKHPPISLINLNEISPKADNIDISFTLGFYTITLKNIKGFELKYGRQYYDFSEGSMMFTAPGQVLYLASTTEEMKCDGWMLCIHPDLLRKTRIDEKIAEYSFFSYDVNEALHLSDAEKEIISGTVATIKKEYSQNLDLFSQDLLISHLDVLLNYSKRFYSRQFITRTNVNKDIVVLFEKTLKECFDNKQLPKNGIPTVKHLAGKLGYSSNYLSDMLKNETGKTTLEHIQFLMLEKSKSMLAHSDVTISEISNIFGFEQQANFSKFFKTKTGISPSQYRKNYSA